MSSFSLGAAIGLVYEQVAAPPYADRNLDALAEVLRDLSWLPPGPVVVRLPAAAALEAADAERLATVLRAVAAETAAGPRPVRLAG